MFHIILTLREELKAAKEKMGQYQQTIHDQSMELREATEICELLTQQNERIRTGAGIIVGANDQLFAVFNSMRITHPELWDSVYDNEVGRLMMRTDMGAGVMHGVPIVDLTADTEMESSDEETEDEGPIDLPEDELETEDEEL